MGYDFATLYICLLKVVTHHEGCSCRVLYVSRLAFVAYGDGFCAKGELYMKVPFARNVWILSDFQRWKKCALDVRSDRDAI